MFAKVKMFKVERGFGFFKNPTGADDIFFHISEIIGMQKEDIRPDMLMEFTLGTNKGKPIARDIRPVVLEQVGGGL